MGTFREADLVRRRHAEMLRRLGAHAIEVGEVKRRGVKTFAVIVYSRKKPAKALPRVLEVKSGNKVVKIPLVARIAEPFRPESVG